MSRRIRVVGLLGASLGLLLAGCRGGPQGGQTMRVGVGDVGRVVLSGHAGTGYIWKVDREMSEGLQHVVVSEPDTTVASGDRVGGPQETVFRVEGASSGIAEVRFEYVRPWEQDTPAARTATYQITVR